MFFLLITIFTFSCIAAEIKRYDLNGINERTFFFTSHDCVAIEVCAGSAPIEFTHESAWGPTSCLARPSFPDRFYPRKCDGFICSRDISTKLYTLPTTMCIGVDIFGHWLDNNYKVRATAKKNSTFYVITGHGKCDDLLKESHCPIITEFAYVRLKYNIVTKNNAVWIDTDLDSIAKSVAPYLRSEFVSWKKNNLINGNLFEMALIVPRQAVKGRIAEIEAALNDKTFSISQDKRIRITSLEINMDIKDVTNELALHYGISGGAVATIVIVTLSLTGLVCMLAYRWILKRRLSPIRL